MPKYERDRAALAPFLKLGAVEVYTNIARADIALLVIM